MASRVEKYNCVVTIELPTVAVGASGKAETHINRTSGSSNRVFCWNEYRSRKLPQRPVDGAASLSLHKRATPLGL